MVFVTGNVDRLFLSSASPLVSSMEESGKQGVFSCQNAITYPQPYRKWTDQMIAVLGDSQELTFSFYHQ